MFDIGFSELTLIGVLALIVLGPKRLPEVARTAGYWLGRLRSFVASVRQDIDRELEGSELEELRRLKQELDDTRAMIRQHSTETYEQFRALDELITADHTEELEPSEEPGQPEELESSEGLQQEPKTAEPSVSPQPRPKKKSAKKPAKKSTSKKKVAKKNPADATAKRVGKKKRTPNP